MDENMQKELEEAKAKAEEYLNGWKRERADFLNYKKDESQRISEMATYAGRALVLKMLPLLDHLSMAEEKMPDELKNNDWSKGFGQIKKNFQDFLKREGIEEIETVGKPFDPNFMESIEEEEGGEASGNVIEELQKGYTMDGKLIRPAKVKVSK